VGVNILKNLFAERFSELLEQHLWSYEELAKKLGLKSKGTICKYASGNIKNVHVSMVVKLANLYHVSPIWLIGLQNDKYDCLKINETYSLVKSINSSTNNTSDGIILPNKLLNSNDYTAFKCKDSSMSPLVNPNDLLLIKITSEFENENLCLISKNENLMIRKLLKNEDNLTLIPLNSSFPTEVYSTKSLKSNHIKILGIVKKLERTQI